MKYPGLFSRYERQGMDWVRRLPPEELKVFVDIGCQEHDHGKQGGKARAQTAVRDSRGKFVKDTNNS